MGSLTRFDFLCEVNSDNNHVKTKSPTHVSFTNTLKESRSEKQGLLSETNIKLSGDEFDDDEDEGEDGDGGDHNDFGTIVLNVFGNSSDGIFEALNVGGKHIELFVSTANFFAEINDLLLKRFDLGTNSIELLLQPHHTIGLCLDGRIEAAHFGFTFNNDVVKDQAGKHVAHHQHNHQ